MGGQNCAKKNRLEDSIGEKETEFCTIRDWFIYRCENEKHGRVFAHEIRSEGVFVDESCE